MGGGGVYVISALGGRTSRVLLHKLSPLSAAEEDAADASEDAAADARTGPVTPAKGAPPLFNGGWGWGWGGSDLKCACLWLDVQMIDSMLGGLT